MTAILALLLTQVGTFAQTSAPQPIPKRIVSLQYPRLAHFAGIEGRVTLTATVGKDGSLGKIRATPENVFAGAAKEALAKWLFSGCNRSSGCEVTITFTFVLRDPPCRADACCPEEFQVDWPEKVEVRAQRVLAIVN